MCWRRVTMKFRLFATAFVQNVETAKKNYWCIFFFRLDNCMRNFQTIFYTQVTGLKFTRTNAAVITI